MSSRVRSESVVAHDAHRSSGAATGMQWELSFDHRPRIRAVGHLRAFAKGSWRAPYSMAQENDRLK